VVNRVWPPLLVATTALLAACTVGPSQRPALVVAGTASTSVTPPSSATASVPPLDRMPDNTGVPWANCDTSTRQRLGTDTVPASLTFQCARIAVPLNSPSAPGVGQVRLQLLKVGNGTTPLLVENDLEGLPGTLYAAELASQLPSQLLSTFSLIGVDRRGTGGSEGVHCVPESDRQQIVGYDPTNTDVSGLLAATMDASQQCILALDTHASALDTLRSAQDLEAIREQLGVDHLNAIGHGEGSRVLTTYGNHYQGHVGRFVLDGSPDPGLSMTDAAKARAAAAEATFGAFVTYCQANGCPLGGDPKSTLSQLLAQLKTTPINLPDGTELTNGTALNAVLIGLADRTDWAQLATAIAQAKGGDGTALAAFVGPVAVGSQTDPARLDADLVSGCNDQQQRLAPDQVTSTMKSWTTAYPLFGGLLAQDLLLCGPWPVPSAAPEPPTAQGAPPILVLSTENDPVTPGPGSQRTAQQLDSGVLVSWLGSGHGALGQSACATQSAANFLVNGKVPANPTTCPP
jgi:pimeloyl-ACP methyl ester carboxylesterase